MPATIRCSRSGPKGAWHITPKLPKQQPRALSDERWLELFTTYFVHDASRR